MVGGFFEVEYQFKLKDMFSKEADKIIAKFDKVRDAATRANTRFTELAKNVKTSSENLKQLNHGIKPVNQGLQTMNQSAKAVTASVKAQNKALASQARALKVAKASMVDYNRMAGVMMQAGQGLFRTGNMLGLTVTAPILGATIKGAKTFMATETQSANVAKIASLNKQNRQLLQREAETFSTKNPISAVDVLSIAEQLARANFGGNSKEGVKDLIDRSSLVAQMAEGFGMGSAEAGDSYARMYRVMESGMNLPGSKLAGKFNDEYFEKFVNFLNLLDNSLPTSARAAIAAMKNRTLAGGLQIPGGMDPGQVAVMSAFVTQFKSASRGSFTLDKLWKDFADEKKMGKKFVAEYLENPFEAVMTLFKEMNTIGEEDPIEPYLMGKGINAAYSGEMNLLRSFSPKMAEFAAHWEEIQKQENPVYTFNGKNYSLSETYDEKLKTFENKLKTFGNVINVILSRVFERISPVLIKWLDEWTPKLTDLADAVSNMPRKQLMILVGGLTALALLAPSLMIVGTLLNSLSAIMKAIATVRSGIFISIFKEIETFILNMLGLGSRLGLTTGGATASAVGGAMSGIGSARAGVIGAGAGVALGGMGGIGAKVAGGLGGIGMIPILSKAHIKGMAGGFALKGLKGPQLSMFSKMSQFLGKKMPFLGTAGGFLSSKASTFGKLASGIGKKFLPVTIISSLLEGAITGNWMSALLGGGGGWLGGALGGAAMGTLGGGPIGTLIGALAGGLLGTEAGKGLAGGVKQLFPDIDDGFIESMKLILNLIKVIFKVIGDMSNAVSNFFSTLFVNIGAFFAKHPKIKAFLEMVSNIISDATRHLRDLNNEIETFLGLREGRKDKPKTKIKPVMYQGTWYYTYEDLEERIGRDKLNKTTSDIRNAPTAPGSDMNKPNWVLKIEDGRNPTLTNKNNGQTTVIKPGATLPMRLSP